MNRAETATALGVAASFDGREVTEEDATAWAAALPDVAFTEVRDAIVAHYRQSRFRVMPSDILAIVRRTRDSNRREVGTNVVPPLALADRPAAEQAWMRAYRAALGRTADHDQAVAEACHRVGVEPDPPTPLVFGVGVRRAIQEARSVDDA